MFHSSSFGLEYGDDAASTPLARPFGTSVTGGLAAWNPADERSFGDLMPALFLASDLFAATYLRVARAGCRRVNPLVPSAAVACEGPWLDQGDLDVYLACVSLALRQGARTSRLRCHVEEAARLAGMGGRTGAVRFANRLKRLHEARMEYGDDRFAAQVQLLSSVVHDVASGGLRIDFGHEFFDALRLSSGTARFIADRAALGRDALGKWLLGVVWTLRDPCLIDLQRLRALASNDKGRDIQQLLQEFARRGYIRDMVTRSDGLVIVRPGRLAGMGGVCGGSEGRTSPVCHLLT